MKFYKCDKSLLKWKEMQQLDYKWTLPILVDDDLNVIVGNSLKDSLPDSIIIVKMDNNQRDVLFQALFDIESRIAEEASTERLDILDVELRQFFKEVRKPVIETYTLFDLNDLNEKRCVTPELYIEPPPYDFNKHRKSDEFFNALMLEEFIEEGRSDEPEIEIDMEILKELL